MHCKYILVLGHPPFTSLCSHCPGAIRHLDHDPGLSKTVCQSNTTPLISALHMAVKGVSYDVVKLLLEPDAAIVMLRDKFGNTALHVATRIP